MQPTPGRWVYGIDVDVGLPAYSQESYPSADAAIRAAVQQLGLDAYRFKVTIGRLVRPSPPRVDGRRLLLQLYKDRYENVDAVLYRPSAEGLTEDDRKKWRESTRFEDLEERIDAVITEWFGEGHEMSWLEVVDEYETTDEDIQRVILSRTEAYA